MNRDDDRYEGKPRAMLRRRDLLKLVAAGGVTSSLVALPWLRNAIAQRRPDATADRVLILYFSGGLRSSTAFHASPNTRRYNPWGAIEGTGTPFVLGKLLDDFLPAGTPIITPEMPLVDGAYALSPMGGWGGMRVPRLREVAQQFSVIGTWSTARGDHYRAATEEPSGSSTGLEPGLLTRIGAAIDARGGIAPPPDNTPMTGDGGTPDATVMMTDAGATGDGGFMPVDPRDQIPSFHIQPGAAFGLSTEETARFTPVPIFGINGLPGRGDLNATEARLVGRDWARDDAMRSRLDQRRLRSRTGWGRGVVEQYANDREGRRRVGERLTASWIDISREPMAARGAVMTDGGLVPLTNAMLLELFVRSLGSDPALDGMAPYADPRDSDFYRTATDVALAVRLLQLGSPAIAIEMGGFDTHSGERRDAPARFRFVGRLWATIQFLLSRMPDPSNPSRSMLDRTIVVTMSEFGRDPGSDNSGFNNGEGSDHGGDPACYYFAHGVMGGGVIPNRHVGPASVESFRPLMSDRIPFRRLHSSILYALGVEHDNPDFGYPDAPPVTQLFTP